MSLKSRAYGKNWVQAGNRPAEKGLIVVYELFTLLQTRNKMNNPRDIMVGKHSIRLLVIFFLSGTSALIYQVCWQRLLFGAFGVDIESVTVIVSTFMLGLGCGALLGGQAADRFRDHVIVLFAFCELGIGLFGIISPVVIPAVGEFFTSYDLPVIAVVNFILILIPASFMGATLPMLVAYSVRRDSSVGESIGAKAVQTCAVQQALFPYRLTTLETTNIFSELPKPVFWLHHSITR